MTPNLLDELEKIATGKLDKTAPSVIWLQLDTDGDNAQRDEPWAGRDGVTWCDESIGGLEIQYVRADLYRDMAKRMESAERKLSRLTGMRNEWERDAREHLMTFGQHLPASVECLVERFDAAIDAAQEGEG